MGLLGWLTERPIERVQPALDEGAGRPGEEAALDAEALYD